MFDFLRPALLNGPHSFADALRAMYRSGQGVTCPPAPVTCKCKVTQPRKRSRQGALILELMAVGRPISVTELAQRMCVSVAESSRRVKAAGSRVTCKRVGRYKMVSLPTPAQ